MLNELDLTATNSKTIVEPRLSGEFLRVLAEFPAGAVEAAFRGWRDVSPFFPAISDIRDLAQLWVKRKREACEQERQAEERKQAESARERGELIDFSDILRKLNDTVGKMPEPPHIRRERKVRERAVVATAPAVQMTQEQIEARREAEQAEIQRELKRGESA